MALLSVVDSGSSPPTGAAGQPGGSYSASVGVGAPADDLPLHRLLLPHSALVPDSSSSRFWRFSEKKTLGADFRKSRHNL